MILLSVLSVGAIAYLELLGLVKYTKPIVGVAMAFINFVIVFFMIILCPITLCVYCCCWHRYTNLMNDLKFAKNLLLLTGDYLRDTFDAIKIPALGIGIFIVYSLLWLVSFINVITIGTVV